MDEPTPVDLVVDGEGSGRRYRWEIRDGETVVEHGRWRDSRIAAVREGMTPASRAASRATEPETLLDLPTDDDYPVSPTETFEGRPVADLPSL